MISFATLSAGAWAREIARFRADALPRGDDFVISAHMTKRAREHAEGILGIGPVRPAYRNADGSPLYQETVLFRDHGRISRRQVAELLAASRIRADAAFVEATSYEQSWNPADLSFRVRIRAVETFDGRSPDGGCGADDLLLELSGTVALDGTTRISDEQLLCVPMYRAEPRVATSAELEHWFTSLAAGLDLAERDPSRADDYLADFFLAVPGTLPGSADSNWLRWLPDMAGDLPSLLREELSGNPEAAVVFEEYRCGGITRIRLPFRSNGSGPERRLLMDLVRVSGAWRCVRLAF